MRLVRSAAIRTDMEGFLLHLHLFGFEIRDTLFRLQGANDVASEKEEVVRDARHDENLPSPGTTEKHDQNREPGEPTQPPYFDRKNEKQS